jgi:predicted transcriptional regulator
MASLLEMAAQIVASHASTTSMNGDELLQEIQKVYDTLQGLEGGQPVEVAAGAKPTLTWKQSIKIDEVICLVCGKGKMKTLARHLNQAHDLKPGQYKKQFGIPSKQPLTAKSYSEVRRKMAAERGLVDLMSKAREKRAANIKAKKDVSVKPLKAKAVQKDK